jgi:hypothetical protein
MKKSKISKFKKEISTVTLLYFNLKILTLDESINLLDKDGNFN